MRGMNAVVFFVFFFVVFFTYAGIVKCKLHSTVLLLFGKMNLAALFCTFWSSERRYIGQPEKGELQ